MGFQKSDTFGIQDVVTNKVLASIMTKITMGEDAALDRKLFTSTETFLPFMSWRSNFLKRTRETFIIAEKIERELVTKLPDDDVYRYLVQEWMAFGQLNWSLSLNLEADRGILYQSIDKALALNPRYAYNLAGLTTMFMDINCETASQNIKAFVEAGKNANRIMQMGCVLIPCGQTSGAISYLEIALRLESNAKNAEIKQMIIAAHLFDRGAVKAFGVTKRFTYEGFDDKATRSLIAYIHLLNQDPESAQAIAPMQQALKTGGITQAAKTSGYFCLQHQKAREN